MIKQIPDDLFSETYEALRKTTAESWTRIIHEYHKYLTKECGEGEFIMEEKFHDSDADGQSFLYSIF